MSLTENNHEINEHQIFVKVPIYTFDIYGKMLITETIKKNVFELTYQELIEAKLLHIQKIQCDLNRKEAILNIELLEQRKLNRVVDAT